MKRIRALLMAFVMTFVLMGLRTETVFAAGSSEYLTWLQKDPRWANVMLGWGDSIANSGCDFTCLCIICASADPSLQDPNTFNPGIAAKNGNIVTNTASLGSDAPVVLKGETKYTKAESISKINEDIRKAWESGSYIVLRCQQTKMGSTYLPNLSDTKTDKGYPHHYVLVEGIDSDGYPIVWDVAGIAGDSYPKENNGSGITAHGGSQGILGFIMGFTEYSPKDGYQSASDGFSGVSSSNVKSAVDLAKLKGLVLEEDLVGMPNKSVLMDGQGNITLPGQENLTQSEINTIGHIKDNMGAGKTTFSQILHTVFTVIGLVLMIYAVLLWVAFIFDRVNVFFDFSLVYFLSFGRLRVIANPEKGDVIPQGYISNKVFFIKTAVIFAIGALLVSGVLIRMVERLTSTIGG